MTGVPVVASAVGGVPEIASDADAWPIDGDDPQAYVDALRSILAAPEQARAKALALRERLVADRTEEQYAETAAALLLRAEGAGR